MTIMEMKKLSIHCGMAYRQMLTRIECGCQKAIHQAELHRQVMKLSLMRMLLMRSN